MTSDITNLQVLKILPQSHFETSCLNFTAFHLSSISMHPSHYWGFFYDRNRLGWTESTFSWPIISAVPLGASAGSHMSFKTGHTKFEALYLVCTSITFRLYFDSQQSRIWLSNCSFDLVLLHDQFCVSFSHHSFLIPSCFFLPSSCGWDLVYSVPISLPFVNHHTAVSLPVWYSVQQ